MGKIAGLSNGELEDEITTWAGRVAAGEARLLALIGEFDAREAWAGVGLLSCAHWLSWRLGLGLVAARERVRVARRLRELPAVATALASGRMSYAQVRAITRAARPDDGIDWVDLARNATGAQIEKLARGVRRAEARAEDDADPDTAAHRLRTTARYQEDGTLSITVRLPADDGALVLAALDAVRAELDRRVAEAPDSAADGPTSAASAAESGPDAPHAPDAPAEAPTAAGPRRASDTDALLELSRRALDSRQSEQPTAARRARAALSVHIDPLSGWARLPDGELLPPGALRTAHRSLPRDVRLRPLRPTDLTRHDLSRTRRDVSQPLRDLLAILDGERCRYPGCTRRRNLHAHHVWPWSDGGPTDLANLVLVCARHHTLIHAQGHQLGLSPDRRLTVTTGDGTTVLHHPATPWHDPEGLDPARVIGPDTLPPQALDARLDLHYAVSVLVQHAA